MGAVSDQQISEFFAGFAERLANDAIWGQIAAVNQKDIERARGLGRSTTRLVASEDPSSTTRTSQCHGRVCR